MIIRHLQYLTALSQERHFARAATICNVTQSTLSAGIKQMEDSLGVLLVERGQRFVGLTPEGERVLGWAQRTLADYSGLRQELSELRSDLVGRLRIGVIPAAMPIISLLTTPLIERHAHVRVLVTSLTSIEIQRGLDSFELDVGLTYLDNEPLARVRMQPLYNDSYLLMTHRDGPLQDRHEITWTEAAKPPLCLLGQEMQNRRILDGHFHEAGVEPNVIVETNSLITLWSHLRLGHLSSVVSRNFLPLLGRPENLLALPISGQVVSHRIGLVASDREPLSPVARALLTLTTQLGIGAAIEHRLHSLASP